MSSQPAIETICSTLNEGEERPRSQVTAIVDALGEARAMALLAETQRIELSGGMLVPDGSRRRTPGGVFFVLARRALPPHDRDRIFSEGRQRPESPKPAPAAAVPAAPPRAAPPAPANNGFSARRFEHRSNHSSSSFGDGGSYAHRTSTYTAHGSSRQTTVEFSSRLPLRAAVQPVPEPDPAPPVAPPPKPPGAEQQRLVPLRRRIVSLPALEDPAKKAAESAAEEKEPQRVTSARAARRVRSASAADSAANDTTLARSDTPDFARARAAAGALSYDERRSLLLELVDELGSDRDPTKPKLGLRDLVVSRLGAGLDLPKEHWGPLLGGANPEATGPARLSSLTPDQLERIDRFVTLLVDSLEHEAEPDAAAQANAASTAGRNSLSSIGAELEARTRQFALRLYTMVRSATLQSVQQAFSGAGPAARRSSAPPSRPSASRPPASRPPASRPSASRPSASRPPASRPPASRPLASASRAPVSRRPGRKKVAAPIRKSVRPKSKRRR